MGIIRLCWRIPLIALWTGGWFLLRVLGGVSRVFSRAADLALVEAIYKVWSRGILALIGCRLEVVGTPPGRPFYLVSNHTTLLDVLVLSTQAGCSFVAKGEVARWPAVGTMAKWMNTIFIDRKRASDTKRVNELIDTAMKEGHGIVVFPEAGCGPGSAVLPFKPALLQPAVANGYPVHYAVINYETLDPATPASKVIVWLPGVSFARYCLMVIALPGFKARLTFGEAPIRGEDRKVLAQELWQAVQARFTPVA